MKVFPLVRSDGNVIAFEIEHAWVSRKAIANLLKRTDGVSTVTLRRRFFSADDIRIEFRYRGVEYIVWEPWGDNSRYWIGPRESASGSVDVSGLETVFRGFRPLLLGSLAGHCLLPLLRRRDRR